MSQMIAYAGDVVEQREYFSIVEGSVNFYNHSGNQHGSSSEIWKCSESHGGRSGGSGLWNPQERWRKGGSSWCSITVLGASLRYCVQENRESRECS